MEDHSYEDRHNLVEDLIGMLKRGSTNDVKITLRDGEISANRDILMARNDYFATMFSDGKFIEGQTSSVDMSHCSKAVMEKIIKFLFSGVIKFGDLSLTQLLELSHMSEMMLLDKIKAEVEDYVKRVLLKVNLEENVKLLLPELISGLKFADQYNLSSLKPWIIMELNHGMKVIPDDVECSDSFKTLPFDLILDLFRFRLRGSSSLLEVEKTHSIFAQLILRQLRELKPTSMEKLEVFIVWLSGNDVTEEQKNKIVESFDLDDFTVEELMISVRDSGLYPASKIDERVLDLVKNKDELLKEKDLKIKEQDLKINELKDTVQDMRKHIPSYRRFIS